MNNKPLPDVISIRDKYGPAMEITTKDEADIYWELCVEHSMRRGLTREKSEDVERKSLGYFAGYYDSATAARVLELFGAGHPVFGTRTPSPDEAMMAGVVMAVNSSPKSKRNAPRRML